MNEDILNNLEDRIINILARSIKQLEDQDPKISYTRQQVQSIESIEKTILIIHERMSNRKVENESDKKTEEELKYSLNYEEEDNEMD